MGGEASKEETELASDEVEAVVDVSPVGSAANTPGKTNGDRIERTDPGSTHKIEGDGHGEVRGNSNNVSELEGVGCNIATAGVKNTSFDESRDTLTDDQLAALDSGQKQGESDITEPSLLGALRQSLPIASGIVLRTNSESTEGEDKACRSSNSEACKMENNSTKAKTGGLTKEGSAIDTKKTKKPTETGEMNLDMQEVSAGIIAQDTSNDGGENQPKNSSDNKLEKRSSVGSEGMEEDTFFDADADGDIATAVDTRGTVVNTGENVTPPIQTNNDTGLRSLDDLMGQNPVNITDSKQLGNLQIEQEEGQSGAVEANSQHTCLERVTSQDSNIDGQQPVDNIAANSSQVCSSLAEDAGATPDQSDSDKKANANGDNVSAKVESSSLNEVERHLVCTQLSDETHDVNVAAGMQSHTLENSNADLKALPSQEKEQLPDLIATVSGQDESDDKGYSEAVVATDTSATLNLGQHPDQPISSIKSPQDDVTREDIVDTSIGDHVGVTRVSQNSDKPPPRKEITEEEKSVLSQQAEGDGDTKPSETVKGCDQISALTKETDTSADTSATNMADNNDETNVNGKGDDIPLPKGAYNLDFLDNLDDPNFNPFQSKSKMSVDKTITCIEDKDAVESDKRSGRKMVTSDEPEQTDKSTESQVKPPVTTNSTENVSVITADENSGQGVQSNNGGMNSKSVGKGNSDVNGEIKNEAECDDNENEVGTDVIRVDGSEHMDSPTDESSTAEVREDEPNKHNLADENSVLEAEINAKRCEPAVVTAMDRNNDSELNESKENMERWVKSEQGTAALEKDSSESQIEKQVKDTDTPKKLDSNTDLNDTNNEEDSVRKTEQETSSKSTAQNTSEISGNSPTGSSENDTKSGGSHSSALGIDVEKSRSDTSSSKTVPNTNVADQISSSDIESSCDTIQQNVIEKSNSISNDKTTDKQVDQEGNHCADSCDSDEVQKAEKSPQIKNENLDSLGNTDSEENKMETTVIGNNKSEVRIS